MFNEKDIGLVRGRVVKYAGAAYPVVRGRLFWNIRQIRTIDPFTGRTDQYKLPRHKEALLPQAMWFGFRFSQAFHRGFNMLDEEFGVPIIKWAETHNVNLENLDNFVYYVIPVKDYNLPEQFGGTLYASAYCNRTKEVG